VYAKSKFADDCRSAENQQQDGLHGIASFFLFLVGCCGIAPHIVQRLLISAGHSDASQLCGDPLTAKRSIKAKNEVVTIDTMLPHRSGHPNRKIILYAMYRSNPTLAQIKPIQQRIKSFLLIWSLFSHRMNFN